MQPVPQDLLKEYVQSQHFTSTTEIMDAMKECSWLIKKHNKTGQGQSAPPLFRARQIIG